MHRQQFPHIVTVERDKVCNLLAPGLSKAKPLTGFDFEADIPGGRQRHRLAGFKHMGSLGHDGSGFPLVSGRKNSAINPTAKTLARVVAAGPYPPKKAIRLDAR